MLISALIGAVMALGQAPFDLWPLALVALVMAAILLEVSGTTRRAAWFGWAFGGGYFGVSLSWIVEPFLVDIVRHGWMAPFALFFMAGGLALFWGAAFGLARWLGGQRLAALALVVTLPAVELLRAYVFTGFPWAMPAYIWVGLAPMQLVALIGPHGLNMLTVLMTAGVWGMSGINRYCAVVLGVLAWGTAPVLAIFPVLPASQASIESVTLRLLQPNAPQHQKWDPDWVPVFFEQNLRFTAELGADGSRPDVIIWPETAVPTSRLMKDEYVIELVRDAAQGVPVIFGIGHQRDGGFYNSIAVMDRWGTLTQTYDKMHLVPFGEYVPFGDVMARFGIYGLAANQGFGFTSGQDRQLLDLGDAGQILPLICYEAVFPQDVNAAPDGADWILHLTNDAWFGSVSGPWQHLVQAQFRAVEQGRPLVRTANTGVTAVIDAHGVIQAQIPFETAGYLDADLPTETVDTLYRQTGDWPIIAILWLLWCALTLSRHQSGKGD